MKKKSFKKDTIFDKCHQINSIQIPRINFEKLCESTNFEKFHMSF